MQGRPVDFGEPGKFSPRKLITILVPARNEEGNLPRVYDEVSAVFAALRYDYEVLVLDNASTDDTPRLAREFCRRDQRWRYMRMSRDFSVEGSLAAGLQTARGDAAIVLFSDLQDPTNRIPDFLARWEEGHDVVYGVLETRAHEPFWKSWGARAIYRFLGKFASVAIPPNATDFRLFSRRAINALNECPERHRYLRGLSHWIGFRSCALNYRRRPRVAGKSKASWAVMFHLAGNALTGFSLAPLRACTLIGLTVAAVTILLGCLSFFAACGRTEDRRWLDRTTSADTTRSHLCLYRHLRRIRGASLLGNETTAALCRRRNLQYSAGECRNRGCKQNGVSVV